HNSQKSNIDINIRMLEVTVKTLDSQNHSFSVPDDV
ncbi:hypothetical protein X975_03673, partial [Stegodyphus mimosarum]